MFIESKTKGLFVESDSGLSEKFEEAGFGFKDGEKNIYSPLEAGYLAKIGKSAFDGMELGVFVSKMKKKDKLFPFAFAVYCLIRGKGRIARPFMEKSNFLRVYEAGVGREKDRPSVLLCMMPGKEPSVKSIEDEVKIARLARMQLIIACGDEKELRLYKVSTFNF